MNTTHRLYYSQLIRIILTIVILYLPIPLFVKIILITMSDLIDCDVINVTPKKTKYTDKIIEKDISKIQSYNLDVIIRFGFKILIGEILKSSKYGVWSFHHGDSKYYRGKPAGMWEVLENTPVTGTVLQILSEDLDGGLVISKSYSLTIPSLFTS